MGNKSSSHKDPTLPGEIRGRSRSFTGLTSKFRRANKSPPRERSSSFSDSRLKKGSLKSSQSQNGALKSGQNGHVACRGQDVVLTTAGKSTATNIKQELTLPVDNSKHEIISSNLSQSAPGGRPFHYRTGLANEESTNTPSRSGGQSSRSNVTVLSNLTPEKTGKKTDGRTSTPQKSSDKKEPQLETYIGSPRLSVSHVRQVSRELFADHIEDLSRRRGRAVMNRDLSLSQASLGLLSNKSKSMHSLNSNDYDYEERCHVGELMSMEDRIKMGELCKNITSHFASDMQDGDLEPFMRPRTSSAPSLELANYERKIVAMGTASAQLRQQYAINSSSPKRQNASQNNVQSGVIQARKMLVARALKDEDAKENSSLVSPIVSDERSNSPTSRSISPEGSSVGNFRSKSPGMYKLGRSISPVSNRSVSPLSQGFSKGSPGKGVQQTRELLTHSPLQYINEEQMLATNMTKSMRKFMMSGGSPNSKFGVVLSDYENISNFDKKSIRNVDKIMRDRSSSFSLMPTARSSFKNSHSSEVPTVSKSNDSTPFSTGGDSGFRSRSQSWSSLSRKSTCSSIGQLANIPNALNPASRLWSYSVTSLSEMPMDIPHCERYVQSEETEGVEDSCTFSSGR
ncbi:hypothetical protein ACJMK2_021711 [Sinanodonta woodiana]|uniref:Uncharacterized protein n=1 Tax=Sinanodonta woodiana TaxID=1069815 RepID=A0ABD3TIH2_SINWO